MHGEDCHLPVFSLIPLFFWERHCIIIDMKTVVIYYSCSGNTALMAEMIKTALKADVYEIKTEDQRKRKGFALFFWGGSQVFRNIKPALQPLPVDCGVYDLIILGTPTWAGSPAPALVSFIDKTKITGKKLAFFCSHGGGPGKTFKKLKALLQGNDFIGELDVKIPAVMDGDALKQKVEEWAGKLK
jgi:flavodoxin